MVETNFKSEWNEQNAFSTLYFMLTKRCREAQETERLDLWYMTLINKFSMANGILLDNEKEDINNMRLDLRTKKESYLRWVNNQNIKKVNPINVKYNIPMIFEDGLYLAESKIDTIVNKHMPFLNIVEEGDLTDF